ncbi:MAG: MFS transporter [Bacteroidota bacterium]
MKLFSDHQAHLVLKNRNFKFFLAGRVLITLAVQMQAVIVAWQVYSITHDPLSLGLIGLSEAIAFISMAMFSGWIADKFPRKRIILLSTLFYLFCASSLLLISFQDTENYSRLIVFSIYIVIFITGIVRSFIYPALIALMSQLVPKEQYVYSSSWNSLFWHSAAVGGPAIGGLVYGLTNIHYAYSLAILLAGLSFFVFYQVENIRFTVSPKSDSFVSEILTGLKFVFKNQIVLGALSLDMFAVLFGGAVALLPVFASDVLHTGPQGLGLLRAAPAFGAVMMSLFLAYHPPQHNTGIKLLIAVAGFGISIILFAISRNFLLSFSMLLMSGLFDNISVVIRNTIVQLYTPNEMRGRVASINSVFIGSSNEIGAFESGATARLFGLVPSVIIGGSITVLIAISTFYMAPNLRKLQFHPTPEE